MNGPPKNPARLGLPLAEWPEGDRTAALAARAPESLFVPGGPAATLRPKTWDSLIGAYGRFLRFLIDHDKFDPATSMAMRVAPETIAPYHAWLGPRLRPLSLWSEFAFLYRFARAADPRTDYGWLRNIVNTLHLGAHPAPVVDRMQDPKKAFRAALRLLSETARGPDMPAWKRSAGIRDGLMLGIASSRQPRLRALAAIKIDQNLVRLPTGYVLRFDADEIKTARPREEPLPDVLTPWIDRYLAIDRPAVLKGATSPHLWINRDGQPFDENGILGRLTKVTRRLFGTPMSTRIFRHMAASAIDEKTPSKTHLIAPVLHHTSLAPGEKYYVVHRMSSAVRRYAKDLERLRRELNANPSEKRDNNRPSRSVPAKPARPVRYRP